MQMGHHSQAQWVLKVDSLMDGQVSGHLGRTFSEANQVIVGGELVRVKGERIETYRTRREEEDKVSKSETS